MLARWAVEEGAEIAAGPGDHGHRDDRRSPTSSRARSPACCGARWSPRARRVPVGALLGVVADAGRGGRRGRGLRRRHSWKASSRRRRASAGAPDAGDDRGRAGAGSAISRPGPETGTPILLIHGFGADMSTWMFNQAALAEERPVYAIDLPGHGGSAKEVGDGSTRALAAAVLDYMDAVGIGAAHLVGHSLGGAIAVLIAHDHPDRVAGADADRAGRARAGDRDGLHRRLHRARAAARKLRPVLEMLVANPSLVTADMVEEVLKFKRLDGARGGAARGRRREFLRGRAARLAARPACRAPRAGPDHLGRRRSHPAGASGRRFSGRDHGHAHRRRRPHSAYGEGGGGERADRCRPEQTLELQPLRLVTIPATAAFAVLSP